MTIRMLLPSRTTVRVGVILAVVAPCIVIAGHGLSALMKRPLNEVIAVLSINGGEASWTLRVGHGQGVPVGEVRSAVTLQNSGNRPLFLETPSPGENVLL